MTLGLTDIAIPPMGVGAWAWGDRMFWGYGRGYGEAEVHSAFVSCLAHGLDFIDTAEIYGWGESERLLGRFLKSTSTPAVIATKFFPYPWRLRGQSLLAALRRSLARLGLSRVDLYQIHWPVPLAGVETWMSAMATAVERGWTRAVGVSNYDVVQTERAHAALARRSIPLASNQVRFSLLDRWPERSGLLQLCRDLHVTLIAYSPLGQGLLTGKYTPQHLPGGIRGMRTARPRGNQLEEVLGAMRHIGAAHGGKSPAQVALNWVMAKGAVPIPGAKNAAQAEENAGALGWSLDDQEIAELDSVSEPGA